MVIITRNDIKPREGAEEVFELVVSQVSYNQCVKDVICLSVRNSDNYWSRSGQTLGDSLQTVAKNAKCTTDIDKFWRMIELLFEEERLHLDKQKSILQNSRLEVINAKIELEKKTDHRLEILPDNVRTALTSNSVLCDDNTLQRLNELTEYYKYNSKEEINRHQKIIGVFDNKIKESIDIQESLKKILEKLSWWKTDTVKNLNLVKYTRFPSHSSYSAFDAVKDLSDVTLTKLINSMIDGFDLTSNYNNNGFSVLTYTAYCGNLPALMFILNRIRERYVFMRDRNKRNIMHAAAEGLQLNTLRFLKERYPTRISLKDAQGKTCDEILLENLKSIVKKYEN